MNEKNQNMELRRIKGYGGVKSGRAWWIVRPIRSILWRLIHPYFEGMLEVADERLRAETAGQRGETIASFASRFPGVSKDIAAIQHRLASLEESLARIEGLGQQVADVQAHLATSGPNSNVANLMADHAAKQSSEALVSFASRFPGISKDILAIQYRLAGLEEVLAQFDPEASKDIPAINDRLTGLEGALAQIGPEVSKDIPAIHDRLAGLEGALAQIGPEMSKDIPAIHDRLAGLEEALTQIDRTGLPSAPSLPQADPAKGPMVLEPGNVVMMGTGGLALTHPSAGTRFLVREHDLIGRIIVEGGEWEPHVRAAIEQASTRGGVAIDAGAYIGLHTVTMSRHFDQVHSFEPQQAIYQLLCGNIVLNDCRNVVVHNLALYDNAGRMHLAPPERQEIPVPMLGDRPDYGSISNAAALTFEQADGADVTEVVDAITVDQLALDRVSLIKVDTQGADLHVLRGAEETIRRCRPVVLFEWERNLGAMHGSSLEDYTVFFEKLDYDLSILFDTSPGLQADYIALPRPEASRDHV